MAFTRVSFVLVICLFFPIFSNIAEADDNFYDGISSEIQKKCTSKPPKDESNADLHNRVGGEMLCASGISVKELDTILLPFKQTDKERFHKLMKQQALWNKFVDIGCALGDDISEIEHTEEGFVDTSGTGHGLGNSSCLHTAAINRLVFIRSYKSGKSALFINRIKALQDEGRKSKARLANFKSGALSEIKKSKRLPGQDSVTPLSSSDLKEYVKRIESIEAMEIQLARSICEFWKDVTNSFGGPAGCNEKMGFYLFTLSSFQ